MSETQQLLADYVENGSEEAFSQLVRNYVDFVYSSALRLVNGDAHLAQDITQSVFIDLARQARSLSSEVMLGGWLHRHTCFTARNAIRGETRRRNREREALDMNGEEDHSEENLAAVGPVLDEAINELSAADRTAILLRFFEKRDFSSVGNSMGTSEEAARKRVDRALNKLHGLLTRRGVALSVTGLSVVLAAEVVSAAPVGMAAQITSTALATAAVGTAASGTIFQLITMSKIKVAIITGAIVAVGAIIPVALNHQKHARIDRENAALREKLAKLEQSKGKSAPTTATIKPVVTADASKDDQFRELLRLRGEITRLREQAAANTNRANQASELSRITADPDMWKSIRDQQKAGLGMAYNLFTKKQNFSDEEKEKFTDVLADNVMENVDLIAAVLRDGKTPEEAGPLFDAQEATLRKKLEELLGPEKSSAYDEYTRELLNTLTVEQFKGVMTGKKEEKTEKAKQLLALMQEESRAALSEAGLPMDYQLAPTLNFRNFAYETESEKNLRLLDAIYDKVSKRASFLTAEELKKFQTFRTAAINNNRMTFKVNRTLMSPGSK